MFEVFCPEHGREVLLTTRHIERISNTPVGVIIEWRCWCGATGKLQGAKRPASQQAPGLRAS